MQFCPCNCNSCSFSKRARNPQGVAQTKCVTPTGCGRVKLLDKNIRACKFLIADLTISLQHRCSISSLCVLYKIFHNPLHPFHSELPNLFYPRSHESFFLNVSSSFSLMRFNTSQCSRCFIPTTTGLLNDHPSMTVEAAEQQKFEFSANAFFIGWGWTVVCSMTTSFYVFLYLVGF